MSGAGVFTGSIAETRIKNNALAVLDDRLRRGRAGFMLAAGTVVAAAAMVLSVAPVRAISKSDGAVVSAEEQFSKRPASGQRKSRALDVALFEAAREGDVEGVKEMLEAGADASAKIDGDGSPLIGAAESGHVEILRLLLDVGADPNGAVEGDGSPLIKAAQRGVLEAAQLLIDRGADVNLAVKGDENPLMGAAEGGHLGIVLLLVSKGADIHTRIQNDRYDGGTEWRTAIGQARRNGHAHVVRYLESLGARDEMAAVDTFQNANKVYVLGEVRTPGVYAFKDDMTVADVMAIAGGPTNAAANPVVIESTRNESGKVVKRTVGPTDTVLPNDLIFVTPSRKP